jgi:type IV pilus assembly protein PilO
MATDIRQQINQMPVTHFVLVGILIAAGYYFLMFEGASKFKRQYQQLVSQKAQLESDIQKNRLVVEDLKKFQEEVNQISDQFQAAVEYLPSKSKVEDVLDQLYSMARATGVSLSKVKPSGTERKQFYEVLKVDVQVSGDFKSLTQFLVEVSKLPRIINITGIGLKPSSRKSLGVVGGKLLDLSGVLVTYRYIEEEEAKGAQQ